MAGRTERRFSVTIPLSVFDFQFAQLSGIEIGTTPLQCYWDDRMRRKWEDEKGRRILWLRSQNVGYVHYYFFIAMDHTFGVKIVTEKKRIPNAVGHNKQQQQQQPYHTFSFQFASHRIYPSVETHHRNTTYMIPFETQPRTSEARLVALHKDGQQQLLLLLLLQHG